MTMHLTRIPRASLSEQVTDQIVSQIVSGALKPGDKLPTEPELCASLGVGRSAVREGLRPLALLGLIRVRPGKGTSVSANPWEFFAKPLAWGLHIGEEQMWQLVEARQMLEHGIVGLAAQRRSEEDLAGLRQLLQNMEEHTADPEARLDFDLSFHAQLAVGSHNVVLARLALSMVGLLRPPSQKIAVQHTPDPEFLDLHRRLLAAVERQDPVEAQAAMVEHSQLWRTRLEAIMAQEVAIEPATGPGAGSQAVARPVIWQPKVDAAPDGTS